MNDQTENVWLRGVDEPPPQRTPLRAGPLSLEYAQGDLRYVRLGAHEILRRLYVAVRDRNWNTIPARLSNVQINAGEETFSITFDAEHKEGSVDFAWCGEIEGRADGTLRFGMDGAARSTFLRNRIGFCVLHPAACAGVACTVEHVDGEMEESRFPDAISPHQPFFDIRAITHEVTPTVRAEVRMAGDTFEMEDQRNWTDASFKSYSTPLALPFPVEIQAGTSVQQAVTLSLHGAVSDEVKTSGRADEVVELTLEGEPTSALPLIGLGLSTTQSKLTPLEVERLKQLNLSHLRVDLHLARAAYPQRLRQAAKQAEQLGVELEVALFVTANGEAELQQLRERLSTMQPAVRTWLIFREGEAATVADDVPLARKYLASYNKTARFGGGTDAYFTELNRNRPPVELLEEALDLVCYSLNPQVHAVDDLSLVETPPLQATTVESARRFVGNLPIAVTPVTLRPRFNPNATGDVIDVPDGQLPPEVDARQASLLGAAWTVASLKYLAESGVDSATYYETVGWRGVVEAAAGSPLPKQFPSQPGSVFPLYHVFADVGEFAGAEVLPLQSSEPLSVVGLALRKSGHTRLLLANLTAQSQTVRLPALPQRVQSRRLDAENFLDATTTPADYRRRMQGVLVAEVNPLRLPPYSVVRLDW